jgi:hypothetical protein
MIAFGATPFQYAFLHHQGEANMYGLCLRKLVSHILTLGGNKVFPLIKTYLTPVLKVISAPRGLCCAGSQAVVDYVFGVGTTQEALGSFPLRAPPAIAKGGKVDEDCCLFQAACLFSRIDSHIHLQSPRIVGLPCNCCSRRKLSDVQHSGHQ